MDSPGRHRGVRIESFAIAGVASGIGSSIVGSYASRTASRGIHPPDRIAPSGPSPIDLLGFGLLANAALVVPLLVRHGCWLALLPFAEEPWLRETVGDEFERYWEAVPRFVGRGTFQMRE